VVAELHAVHGVDIKTQQLQREHGALQAKAEHGRRKAVWVARGRRKAKQV